MNKYSSAMFNNFNQPSLYFLIQYQKLPYLKKMLQETRFSFISTKYDW